MFHRSSLSRFGASGKPGTVHFGTLQVSQVTRDDVEKLAATLADRPTQRNRVLAFMSRLFNLTERREWRPQRTNPVRGIERAPEEPRRGILSRDELAALSKALKEAQPKWPPSVSAIQVAALSRLRIGGDYAGSRRAGLTLQQRLPVPYGSPARLQFGASHLHESHLLVERVGARVRRVEIDLADDAVVPRFPCALEQVAVETGRDTLPATALGNDDPVDMDEAPSAGLEPFEVGTAVLRYCAS